MRRFSLYRRGRIWYVQFFNPQTGRYLSGRSTCETNRNAAILVAGEWIRDGIPEPGSVRRRPVTESLDLATVLGTIRNASLTVRDAERIVSALKDRQLIETAVVRAGTGSEELTAFLERFWSYENSPYVKAKLAHGHRIGRRRCYDCLLHVKHYWRPYFQGKKLGQVRKADLQEFSLHLAGRDLRAKTINHILNAGTVALRWAAAEELIPTDPGRGLMKFSGKSTRRGVLTEEEVTRLFALPWADERAYLGNALAMY